MSAFPPRHTQPSTPISAALALQKLQAYLAATRSAPYLLPNATLQSDGPRAASDASSNLVIHNLKRVEAGLKGEWLAPSLELENEGLQGGLVPIGGTSGAGRRRGGGDVDFDTNMSREVEGGGNEEGWQDLEEYQREQSIDEGEIGDRQRGVGPEDDGAIHPGLQIGEEGMTEEMRKKLRKEAKKARREKDRKERVNKKGK